jgi:ABC-2 type transport system permease protein
MLRGLLRLSWLELKIFLREPMGSIGSIVIPVVIFIGLGRTLGPRLPKVPQSTDFVFVGAPVMAALLILINAILSLVTIISIYREGGILKRLRATPLRPATILTAHVLVKLLFTAATLLLMVLAGRRYYSVELHIPVVNFTIALLIATWSTLSMGFVIASMVRTARFAQPLGGLIFYPMIGLSGLFFPVSALSPGLQLVARLLPLTYVVSLLRGILKGDAWSAHITDVAALALVFVICTALSARYFRWE